MAFRSARPLPQDAGLQDLTYGCQGCGAELVRTLQGSTPFACTGLGTA
jgi:hypothetical protein